jgi:hypothetical protein
MMLEGFSAADRPENGSFEASEPPSYLALKK